ncbi:MAG TPA: hypothetical protein VGL56_20545 [Fimbriimonadaceae bacterium]
MVVSAITAMALCGCFRAHAVPMVKQDDVLKLNPADVCSYLTNKEIADATGYGVDSKSPATHILGDDGAPQTDCYISVSGSEDTAEGVSGGLGGFDLSFMTQEDYDKATEMKERVLDDKETVMPILEPVPGIGDSAIWVAENSLQKGITTYGDKIYVKKGDVLFCIDPPFARKGTTLKQAGIALAKLVASRLNAKTTPLAVIKMKSEPPKAPNPVPVPAPVIVQPNPAPVAPQQDQQQNANQQDSELRRSIGSWPATEPSAGSVSALLGWQLKSVFQLTGHFNICTLTSSALSSVVVPSNSIWTFTVPAVVE